MAHGVPVAMAGAMSLVRSLLVAVPLAALLACGGSVSRLDVGDGGGDDGPNTSCPQASAVDNGVSCSQPGLSCPGAYSQPTCDGGIPVQCTCTSGSWQCPLVSGGIYCPPPPTGCPAPGLVTPSGSCSADPSLSCTSTIPIQDCSGNVDGYLSCSCQGGAWNCPEPGGPLCVPDAAPTCPSPDTTYAGQPCTSYGIDCGGDPQTCGGQIVYDVLTCQAGAWTVVATTSCAVDAGPLDAGPVDGSFVDSEGPDAGMGI